ncbi:Down syndrome cell adhesion molecule-like protein Dscam2 [Centruroides sculpturatus]|uniref:Down syndrome cell adhesion molecule-like protein Dscam2 n=1 Tax=Centruroides sculpturatus TaxID=218467 RepID=UPI000C6E194E|nr:Down syndrome cell adhesion molecule-like protein Dscam2 [Centruroides sculpturatus]
MVWHCIIGSLLMLAKGILAYMDYRAPTLTLEPPSRLTFLNSTGGSAPCSVIGNPRPTVYWVTSDGTPVTNIPGLRTSLPNGTLYFPPFPSERYRQDIHSAVYRCVASNLVGKVGSRDVHVRAANLSDRHFSFCNDSFVIITFDQTTGWPSELTLHSTFLEDPGLSPSQFTQEKS